MTVYYIDPQNGLPTNDGLSPETPLTSETQINVQSGDTVLFKCGSIICGPLHNCNGADGKPVTYGAYGEGEMPIITTAVDCGNPADWQEIAPNIWKLKTDAPEVANFVFNHGNRCGTLRWSLAELVAQGDFYDNAFGCTERHKPFPESHEIFLYSCQNPGLFYERIEGVFCHERVLATAGQNQIIRDLHFTCSGVHAIAGSSNCRNFKVENCRFSYIGGCVWDADLKIRFGNAIEMWETADNVEVIGCTFDEIYDSAVTHQGDGSNCKQATRLMICGNTFSRCGMAAYEQRDKMPIYAEFCDNICRDAGNGFSKNGEIMPRRSEIWPQPMGHHIFLWRMDTPDETAKLVIRNNRFGSAIFGAAVYSVICRACENQLEFSQNEYDDGRMLLVGRLHGIDCNTVDAFRGECGENS